MTLVPFFIGCGESASPSLEWVPSELPSTSVNNEMSNIGEIDSLGLFDYSFSTHPSSDFAEAMLEDSPKLSEMLWDNQRMTGIYNPQGALDSSDVRLSFFFSSSEGDDLNDGRSPDHPKKTLTSFSNISGVNIFLKSGDTFDMDSSFYVGSKVIMAAYGDGNRPVLNFYRPLDIAWEKDTEHENIWVGDLSALFDCEYEDGSDKTLNFGHLKINEQTNWRRKAFPKGEEQAYIEYLITAKDGSYIIDYENKSIMIYSDLNLNEAIVQYANPVHGLILNSIRNSTILGIDITGAGYHGISISEVENVTISCCYIHNIGGSMLNGTSTRYGNGIEIWDGAQNVYISDNLCEWIFDSCYTDQGKDAYSRHENISFFYNIGRYSFWGIESWGGSYISNGDYSNVEYANNLLLYTCDITSPDTVLLANEKSQTIDENGDVYNSAIPYLTYRSGDYPFSQMATLNVAQDSGLKIHDNVFAFSNRCLLLVNIDTLLPSFPGLDNNIFIDNVYDFVSAKFRYRDSLGTIKYVTELPFENNVFIENNSDEMERIFIEYFERESIR